MIEAGVTTVAPLAMLTELYAGVTPLMKREEARTRPSGLAQGPDGTIYISDMVKGRIWRIVYRGGAQSQ